MQVLFFKSIRPPVPAAPSKPKQPEAAEADCDDQAGGKPAHQHLRELADMLEQREADKAKSDGADATADAAAGQVDDGATAADKAATGGGAQDRPGEESGEGGDDGEQGAGDDDGGNEAGGDDGGAEYGPDTVQVGAHVAFAAGEFKSAGEVTAAGEDGCTVKDRTGREHRVRWEEVTGMQDAAQPAAGDDQPGGGDAPMAKAHIDTYTRKDGTVVQAHDDMRQSASGDLGSHKIGDTVSYKGERGSTRTGKVKGARDGKVIVEHKAGYTELKHHSELSAVAPKGRQ